MFRNFVLIIFSSIFILTSSCNDDEDDLDTLGLLNSSSWLGVIESHEFDYDADNNLIGEDTYETPEGQLDLFFLNDDQSALIKYECDRISCDGNVYSGKWKLMNNTLKVTINREEINALADAVFIEGEVYLINASELVLEVVFNAPGPSVAKRVRRLKYIRSE